MSLGFGTSFWWVLVLEQWSNSKKSASIMSSSRWLLRMSRIILYMASGITSLVLLLILVMLVILILLLVLVILLLLLIQVILVMLVILVLWVILVLLVLLVILVLLIILVLLVLLALSLFCSTYMDHFLDHYSWQFKIIVASKALVNITWLPRRVYLIRLSEHFSQWSYHIFFPELATTPLKHLKKVFEKISIESFRRVIKRFIDQVNKVIMFSCLSISNITCHLEFWHLVECL